MIYTVTTVDTNSLFPEIQTTPYGTLDKAITAIEEIIYAQELILDDEQAEDVKAQIAELKENEYGDIAFDAADFYINLDCFCSVY